MALDPEFQDLLQRALAKWSETHATGEKTGNATKMVTEPTMVRLIHDQIESAMLSITLNMGFYAGIAEYLRAIASRMDVMLNEVR